MTLKKSRLSVGIKKIVFSLTFFFVYTKWEGKDHNYQSCRMLFCFAAKKQLLIIKQIL